MRKTFPAILLILFALALYCTPRVWLTHWRLSSLNYWVAARSAFSEMIGSSEYPSPDDSAREHFAAVDSPTSLSADPETAASRRRLVQAYQQNAALRARLKRWQLLRQPNGKRGRLTPDNRTPAAAAAARRRDRLPLMRFQVARVIGFPNFPQGDELAVDRGARNGVRQGDAVVVEFTLVGTLSLIVKRTAQVRLISSADSFIPAQTGAGDGVWYCAVIGLGGGRARVVFYAPIVNVHKGDAVVTSGLLRRLPAGLLVGTLAEDTVDGNEPNTREAPLTLALDRMQLSELLIVERVGE